MIASSKRQPAETAPRRRGSLDRVLVNAAMDLFASYGYRGTSLARIARAAGVTKGALYWHFDDKEDFFLAVVDQVLNDWQSAYEQRPAAKSAAEYQREFIEVFETSARLNEKNPWVSRLLLIIALESHKIGPRVLRAMRKGNDRQFKHLRLVIGRGKELGVLDPALDVNWAATQLWSSTVGVQMLWYLHGPRFDLRRAFRRQARDFLRQWSARR